MEMLWEWLTCMHITYYFNVVWWLTTAMAVLAATDGPVHPNEEPQESFWPPTMGWIYNVEGRNPARDFLQPAEQGQEVKYTNAWRSEGWVSRNSSPFGAQLVMHHRHRILCPVYGMQMLLTTSYDYKSTEVKWRAEDPQSQLLEIGVLSATMQKFFCWFCEQILVMKTVQDY